MKKYLLTGFVFLMPIVLTLLVIVFLFDLFTDPLMGAVAPLVYWAEVKLSFYPSHKTVLVISRLLAFVLLMLFILLLGAVIRWFFGKELMHLTNRLLDRIPIVKTVYKTSRDLLGAFFSTDGKKAFHYPVAIPFPSPPQQAVGFLAGQVAEKFQEKVPEPLASVFVPTAPHPLSGFLLLIPQKDIEKLDMTNEQAFKFLVSCGMMVPPHGK